MITEILDILNSITSTGIGFLRNSGNGLQKMMRTHLATWEV